jgi:hypothetical protein
MTNQGAAFLEVRTVVGGSSQGPRDDQPDDPRTGRR